MRKGLIFAIPAVLVMLASGCARDRILAPAREPSSTDASYSPQFVLHSLDDPALPAPGREAEAATTQDGALLDRLQMTRRPGPGGDTPSAIVFWNRLTTELGVGANQPPPLLARSYALVQVGITTRRRCRSGFGSSRVPLPRQHGPNRCRRLRGVVANRRAGRFRAAGMVAGTRDRAHDGGSRHARPLRRGLHRDSPHGR